MRGLPLAAIPLVIEAQPEQISVFADFAETDFRGSREAVGDDLDATAVRDRQAGADGRSFPGHILEQNLLGHGAAGLILKPQLDQIGAKQAAMDATVGAAEIG